MLYIFLIDNKSHEMPPTVSVTLSLNSTIVYLLVYHFPKPLGTVLTKHDSRGSKVCFYAGYFQRQMWDTYFL